MAPAAGGPGASGTAAAYAWTREQEERYQQQLQHLELLVRLRMVLQHRLEEERLKADMLAAANALLGCDPGPQAPIHHHQQQQQQQQPQQQYR